LDVNNDVQLRMFMKNLGLNSLLHPFSSLISLLFSNGPNCKFWDSIIEDCKGKYLNQSSQLDQLPIIPSNPNYRIRVTNECAFEILDGDIWKIDFEKVISNILKTSDELDNNNFDETIKNLDFDIDSQISIHSFNLHNMDISKWFEEVKSNEKISDKMELTQNLIKWEVTSNISDNCNTSNIKLQVFKKINVDSKWELSCMKVENFKSYSHFIYGMKFLNDSDIIILTEMGLLIYHYNENNKSIYLNYFYYIDLSSFRLLNNYDKEIFSKLKDTLPLPNYDSFKLCYGWVSNIINNKELLLKYGVELLNYAIRERNLGLIDDIYKKCIFYFKQNLRNNNTMFLSIITSTMPLLNIYYPEYIKRYSLETSMIIDSPVYNIESLNKGYLHLYSFKYPHVTSLNILWKKYGKFN
jgi:hypothetical protein